MRLRDVIDDRPLILDLDRLRDLGALRGLDDLRDILGYSGEDDSIEQITVPVTVRNDTGKPGTIQVGLTAEGPVQVERAQPARHLVNGLAEGEEGVPPGGDDDVGVEGGEVLGDRRHRGHRAAGDEGELRVEGAGAEDGKRLIRFVQAVAGADEGGGVLFGPPGGDVGADFCDYVLQALREIEAGL